MTSIAAGPLTLDQFLAEPEAGPPWREFLRGEVTEKPMPAELHGMTVIELGAELRQHLKRTGEGYVVTEVRHADRDQDWVYLPDLNVRILRAGESRAPQTRGAVERAPDFAIEVLSPDDRVVRWLERVELYLAAGTRLLWVVDPEDETVRVYQPGSPARSFGRGDVLDAEPVLHGFSLDLAAFFGGIRDPA